MRKIISLLLVFVMLCPVFAVSAAEGETVTATFIYVATNGSDDAAGSIDAPFATLQKAVEEAENISGTVVINLRGGVYPVSETVILDSDNKNLVIRAYPGESVEITGGSQIPYSAFKKADEEFTAKLSVKSAADKVMVADLDEAGIGEIGDFTVTGFGINRGYAHVVTYKDEYLTAAQYPNGADYMMIQSVIEDGSGNETVDGITSVKYTVDDDRYKKWDTSGEIWSVGFPKYDWADITCPVEIGENGTFSGYTNFDYYIVPDRRVKFFNVPEEIDVPGEWYIDKENSNLYIILPEGFKAGESLVYSANNIPFMSIEGAEDVIIQNIRFAYSLSDKPAISVKNSENVVFDGIEITGSGEEALSLINCKDSGIRNSYIHDTSGRGIAFDCGDRQTLTPANCFVENCHLARTTCYKKTYAPAISMIGVGNRVSNCEIHDLPHFAISYSANDTVFEYNDIYDVCRDTADSGAIYTCRNWTMRGNIIRYNYFHDMQMIDTTTGMEMQAVYLDDMHASTSVYSNVFYKVDSVALFGGGRNNTFVNNLMLECKKPFVMDNRGLGWASSMTYETMGLTNVPYKEGIWAEKYPELVDIEKDDPYCPKYNTIRDNVIYKTPDMSIVGEVYEYGTVENNIAISKTSDFVKYGTDFTVKEDGEILKKIPDFEIWDFNKVGRYEYEAEDIYVEAGKDDSDSIKVLLNGSKLSFADVEPQIINDRTMVPLRAIFEALGAEIAWDDASKTVTATRGDVTIKMTIGADSFYRNDESVSLDSPATIVDSRTLVPVRAIAESFGCNVGWIAETKTVTIEE